MFLFRGALPHLLVGIPHFFQGLAHPLPPLSLSAFSLSLSFLPLQCLSAFYLWLLSYMLFHISQDSEL